jgi:preprotein translocase subunit Sec61beta
MAEKERSMMPQSTAGLIRYFDTDEGIKIKPGHVVAISIAFAGLAVLLRFLAV